MEILVFISNSVDPDPTSRSVASDQGLHCLPISFISFSWKTIRKWVKYGKLVCKVNSLKPHQTPQNNAYTVCRTSNSSRHNNMLCN